MNHPKLKSAPPALVQAARSAGLISEATVRQIREEEDPLLVWGYMLADQEVMRQELTGLPFAGAEYRSKLRVVRRAAKRHDGTQRQATRRTAMNHWDLIPGETVTLKRIHDGAMLEAEFAFRDTVRACFYFPKRREPELRETRRQIFEFCLAEDGGLFIKEWTGPVHFRKRGWGIEPPFGSTSPPRPDSRGVADGRIGPRVPRPPAGAESEAYRRLIGRA